MSQWLPQNIQKRLLLYVLQQLSLFSGIDLPNLKEVSLNNIVLNDVSLDPEKVGKLAGFNFRFGQVGHLEINPVSNGVLIGSGGISIDARDIEIVLAPDIDMEEDISVSALFLLAQSTADFANTLMSDVLEESDMEELGSSGENEPRSGSRPSSSSTNGESPTKKPSALSGVMAKAVEMALARLRVRLEHLRIKIVSELTDIVLEIDELTFSTQNGVRKVLLSGVRLVTLRPYVNPGDFQTQKRPENKEKVQEQQQDDGTKQESESKQDDDDDDYDDDDDKINDSLLDSMVFTHEEASSIYMSAIDQSFEGNDPALLNVDLDNKPGISKPEPVNLFHINNIQIEFKGLSPISDLTMRIDCIKIALTPLFSTAMYILAGITRSLKLKEYQRRKQNYSKTSGEYGASRFPQYSNDDEIYDDEENGDEDAEEVCLFSKLQINDIILSTNSALTSAGEFASTNTINVAIHNFNIKQKNLQYIFGGIETLRFLREEQVLFSFKNPTTGTTSQDEMESSLMSTSPLTTLPNKKQHKADIRFEIISNDSTNREVVVLLSKMAVFRFDAAAFAMLSGTLSSVLDVFSSVSNLRSALDLLNALKQPRFVVQKDSKLDPTTQFILQTSNIAMELVLSEITSITSSVSPIYFNLLQNQCSIDDVIFSLITSGLDEKIGQISKIKLSIQKEEFKTFINRFQSSTGSNTLPREINMSAATIIGIDNILVELKLIQLRLLISGFSAFIDECSRLKMAETVSNQISSTIQEPLINSIYLSKQRKGARLGLNSVHNLAYNGSKLNIASFKLNIDQIWFKITEINPDFDSLVVSSNNVLFYQLKDDIHGSIPTVNAYRYSNGEPAEYLIHPFNDKKNIKFPLILIHFKNSDNVSSIDITIRNILIEYYTSWLELLSEKVPISKTLSNSEMPSLRVKEVADSLPSKKSSNFDIRITLYDCVCGLNPLRLKSKGYVVVSKGTSDVIFGNDQISLKSSLRNISVFIIDDIQNESLSEQHREDSKSIAPTYISPITHYLSLGYLNVGSINVTHIGITFNSNIARSIQRNNKLGIRDSLSLVDIKMNSDEHQIDVCADSAHTLLQMVNDLKLPLNFTDADRAKVQLDTEIDLLKDASRNEFSAPNKTETDIILEYESVSKHDEIEPETDQPFSVTTGKNSEESELVSTVKDNSTLSFDEHHFSERSNLNDIDRVVPVKVNVNLSKVKIFLYDGYDWKVTRKAIKGAAKRLETKLKKQKQETGERDFAVVNENIEENLFDSICLTMPAKYHIEDFTDSVNNMVQNNRLSEDVTNKLQLNASTGKNYKNLKLRRSAYHKILIDVRGIEVDVVVFSSRDPRYEPTDPKLEVEILSSVEVRLDTVDVYDNLQTSTWNKFLSYMNILGEREIGTSMLKLSIVNVRPDPKLVSSEAVVDVSILPLRLHIDQDTLEFLGRFFAFKDQRFYLPPDEDLYFQHFKISSLKLKIDYKPKAVDYAGLRSGNTGEFINFFILDGSELTLRPINTYGILGIPRLSTRLGNIWGPQIQQTQIGGLLAGLSPLRSIVNIGGGVKDLVVIPIREYKKDGRLFTSLKKGTTSFAKTTGYEIINLGAKLASGAQVLLEQGEEMLGGQGQATRQVYTQGKKNRKEYKEDSHEFLEFYKAEKNTKSQKNLLASSQMLNQSTKLDNDQFGGSRQYSYIDIDDDIYDEELDEENERTFLEQSILLLDSVNAKSLIRTKHGDTEDIEDIEEEEEEEDESYNQEKEKLISLYSNQPETIEQGIKSAYQSMGKNLMSTKKIILQLKDDVNEADSFQEALITVLKSSPIVLIRPLIGTTEAISKTLMGISNEIDPQRIIESKDKYRYDES